VTDNSAAVRRRLKRDRQLFLLACDGPLIVGSLIGGWDGWRGSMARLAVDPQYRRRGIAAMLVTQVEKELRALGAVRIAANVLAKNAGGRAFWSSSGYDQDREATRYIKDLPRMITR
jgi:ribosomal protein S18 acetylase RimI-like enzyme